MSIAMSAEDFLYSEMNVDVNNIGDADYLVSIKSLVEDKIFINNFQ